MDYSSIFTERTTGTYWMKQLDTETFTLKNEWVHPVSPTHNNMIFLDDGMLDINERTRNDFYWFIDDKFYVVRQLTIAELRDKIGQSTPISKPSGNVIDEKIKIVKVEDISISSILKSKELIWGEELILGDDHDLEDSKTLGVGPKKLIGGNMEAGFFGETSAKYLITGNELADLIGLTYGVSQFSNEPWLKFAYKGKIQYVAKKPFRHSISWDNINDAKAVYGDRIVEIGGKRYKIRLLRGLGEDKKPSPEQIDGQYNGEICHNSEWNKLMLPIHVNAPSNWSYHNNVNSPTEYWGVNYTDEDLITINKYSSGSSTWCQENTFHTSFSACRGFNGVSYSTTNNVSSRGVNYGWRPVLELIQ